MYAQRSFDDLGTPLAEVTFCVVDLETTGGSRESDAITEIGALRVRRGEVLGAFQTLVDPEAPVPAFVRLLTGIGDEMVRAAPRLDAVLPAFLEFVGGAVVVAHNARFDVGFLDAALTRRGYPCLRNPVVDTAVLARRILAGEVGNHRLATLADYLRCAHRPRHRAFPDVLATTDVLHALIERVAGFGVTTLEDLVAISRTRIDGTFAKIALAADVPRGPGVYRFVGAGGRTLYVGKAADLRSRVRSYFYGDPRRNLRSLLTETQEVRAERRATMLEAEVAEARAIAAERPPYNRAGKGGKAWYLKASLGVAVPRLGVARHPRRDRALYVGPLPSRRVVEAVLTALRDALPLHRCADPARCDPCPFRRLGTCAGAHGAGREEVRRAVTALVAGIGPLLDALEARMRRLAGQGRFEEAAEVRDRGAHLERTAFRHAEVTALLDAGEVALEVGGRALLVVAGRLAAAVDGGGGDRLARLRAAAVEPPPAPALRALSPEAYVEAAAIARWVRRHAGEVRLLAVSGSWAHPAGAPPPERFTARRAGEAGAVAATRPRARS